MEHEELFKDLLDSLSIEGIDTCGKSTSEIFKQLDKALKKRLLDTQDLIKK